MSTKAEFNDRMLSLGLARVAEQAALASASLIGRGDEKAADQALGRVEIVGHRPVAGEHRPPACTDECAD